MIRTTDLRTWASSAGEFISTTITSNYASVCQFAPNIIVSFGAGVLEANRGYQKRFGSNGFDDATTYGAQFLLRDYLRSRSAFTGTAVGSVFYWIGGMTFSSLRTSFLVDQLYYSIWVYPYNLVEEGSTVIPYFYPKFSGAPIITEEYDDLEQEQRAIGAARIYRPTYLLYWERQRETLLPLAQRHYIDRSMNPKLENADTSALFYANVDPFSGKLCMMRDRSIWGRVAYLQAKIITYGPPIRTYMAQIRRYVASYFARFWKSDNSSKIKNPSSDTSGSDWKLQKELENFGKNTLWQAKNDTILDDVQSKRIDDGTQKLIETYKIRRVMRPVGERSKLLITIPDDVKDDQWENNKKELADKLAIMSGAELCFVQEWATADTHNRAAELINLIKDKRPDDKTSPLKITYHDINPKDCLTNKIISAFQCSAYEREGLSQPCIYTIGMNNPNKDRDDLSGVAYVSNLEQHKITGMRCVTTAFAMTASEFMADTLLLTMDRVWESGSLLVLLSNPHIVIDSLLIAPRFLMKACLFPLKISFYLLTMAYFYVSKKNKSVFEIPSESVDVYSTKSRMRMPSRLEFKNSNIEIGAPTDMGSQLEPRKRNHL